MKIGMLMLMLLPMWLGAQVTISGIVREAGSGEALSYTQVTITGTRIGRLTNESGFFSINTPQDTLELSISRMGYAPLVLSLSLSRDTFMQVVLTPRTSNLDTVVIEASQNFRDLQLGRTIIPMAQIKNLPALAGEGDALKSLQLLPGIQFGQEGTSGLFVRGGTPDQNLILLDEMPVYNVSHLFGFFSLFPPGVIQDMELYKGSFPAQYGGRLSSVIRIQTKEGDMEKWKAEGNLGILSGQIRVEGPLIPGKSSVFFAARRSLLDLFLRPITNSTYKANEVNGSLGYSFYDFIAKANYLVSPRSRLFLSVYAGTDRGAIRVFPEQDQTDSLRTRTSGVLKWGNITTSLRYQHVLSKRWFSKTIIGYTQYRYAQEQNLALLSGPFNQVRNEVSAGNYSFIQDWIAKQEWQGQLGKGHEIRLGLQGSVKRFEPNVRYAAVLDNTTLIDTASQGEPLLSDLVCAYAGYHFSSSRVNAYAGVRAERYSVEERSWWSIQPRLQAAWFLSDRWKIEAGYSSIQQYVHLLTDSGVGLPTDLWVPATNLVPPAMSHQVSGGIFHEIDPRTSLSVEAYWKTLSGVIEYKEGVSYLNNFMDWQALVDLGEGKAYGLEVFLHRKSGRINGWVSYTLSKATRQFEEINGGREFPFRYDRRHNFSLFANYTFPNPNRSLSLTWMYISGAKATVPTSQYQTPYDILSELSGAAITFFSATTSYLFGNIAFYNDSRNNFQIRPFHKLDLAYRARKEKKHFIRTWEFGIYNVYGRRNPYYLFLGTREVFVGFNNVEYRPSLQEYSLLMWIPYVGYQIEL